MRVWAESVIKAESPFRPQQQLTSQRVHLGNNGSKDKRENESVKFKCKVEVKLKAQSASVRRN